MRTFNQSTEKKGLPAVCPDSFVLKGPKYLKVAKKIANLGKFYYQRFPFMAGTKMHSAKCLRLSKQIVAAYWCQIIQ